VLAIAIVLGPIVNLALPFAGDQALFAVGARHILGGEVLYRDFWDLKQPAVYWFFAAANVLFGRGPVPVHLLEGLWDALLAVSLAAAAKRWLPGRSAWLLLPLLGVTYAQVVTTSFDATQVEALAPLLLFLALWAFVEALASRRRALLLFCIAGAAASGAMLFKLLFAIVIFAMWAFAAGGAGKVAAHRTLRDICAIGAALMSGMTIPLMATAAYFATHGALDRALTTWFVFPPEVVREIPHQSVRVFTDGVIAYVKNDAPLITLAALGVAGTLRSRNPLTSGAAGWIIGAVATIALQVTSWWSYQWQLLAIPTALLAVAGIPPLLAAVPRRKSALAAALASMIVLYPVLHMRAKLLLLAHHGFGFTAAGRDAIQLATSPALGRARDVASGLPAVSDRGLYVFGDPILYEVLGARQPVGINGWAPELLTRRLRAELVDEMRSTRPRLIFVDGAERKDFQLFLARSPDFWRFLKAAYEPKPASHGRLYSARSP